MTSGFRRRRSKSRNKTKNRLEVTEVCWPAKNARLLQSDMDDIERKRISRKRRRDNGLCQDCGKPLDRKGARCIKCNQKLKEYLHKREEDLIGRGVCVSCGKVKAQAGKKLCEMCAAKHSETTMRNRKKEQYNKHHAEYARRKWKERIANGICPECGKRKVDYGFKSCGICREKNRKRWEKIRPQTIDRIENGICLRCDNPVKPGFKVCQKHYDQLIEMQKHPSVIENRLKSKARWESQWMKN